MKKLAMLLGIILISSGVLASISIGEPEEIYNLGDKLDIDLTGIRGAENGNMDINLICGNSSTNLVRIPARDFSSKNELPYSTYKILSMEDLGRTNLEGIMGTCQIVASLGGDVASSKSFEITRDISVSASTKKTSYNPGETVNVNIKAVKSNGENVDGFVEGSNASSFNEIVSNGLAVGSFVIPETAEAGLYQLKLYAYDTSDSEVLNEGMASISYVVNQIATSLVLSLSDSAVVPGENFTVGTNIFDQSGVEMSGEVSVKIISSEGEEIENMVMSAGEFSVIDFGTNSSVGIWKIASSFDGLTQEREFEMMPLQKVEFDFEDSVLVVRNVGNVLYNKTIDVLIGGETKKLELKMDVGDTRKFNLNAPMGDYDVVVGDGEDEISRQVLLTGNAISVSDLKNGGILRNYPIVWIFFIVIFGGIGGVLFARYRKTRKLDNKENLFSGIIAKVKGIGKKGKSRVNASKNVSGLKMEKKSLPVQKSSPEDKKMVDFTVKRGLLGAESALVLKGEKHVSAIVSISIKDSLENVARDNLKKIVENSKGKGVVDYRGDYIFIIFNPLITRTYKNEGLAVQCGMKMAEELTAHNRKFKDKINFGIGVHIGDLIASKEGGKLKYTGTGNAISFAKRMSDIAVGRVVVGDIVRKKMMRELKISKGKEIGENQTYVVDEVRDRSGDAERLKQLLRRV